MVKPQTQFPVSGRDFSCRYVSLIGEAFDAENRPFVATATHFVSYAWGYSWGVVYSALESFEAEKVEAGKEPSYFFIGE